MSLNAIKTLPFRPAIDQVAAVFELRVIELDTACVVHENETSDYYQVFWIAEGSGNYEIDFESFSIEENGLFFLSPGQVFCVASEKIVKAYHIFFDREFYCIETHGKEIACNGVLFNQVSGASALQLSPEAAQQINQWFKRLEEELTMPGTAHKEMLETYLRMILIEALRNLDRTASPPVKKDSDSALFLAFTALIEQHYMTLHSVSDYAERLGVTPKSLAKRLKASAYPTPTQIIGERIVLQAKRKLRYTRQSVKEIAYDLGFEDPAYFSRFFTKFTQISPQKYRTGQSSNL